MGISPHLNLDHHHQGVASRLLRFFMGLHLWEADSGRSLGWAVLGWAVLS